jgi:hypothetical protein
LAREWNSQLGYLVTFARENLSARQPTAIGKAKWRVGWSAIR